MPYPSPVEKKKMPRVIWISYFLILLWLGMMVWMVNNAKAASPIKESTIFQAVNQQRIANHLKPLTPSPLLVKSAQLKADDESQNGYFAHQSPSGKSLKDLLKKTGYKYRTAGENLAEGYLTSEDTIYAWMHSPTHKANILDPDFTEGGIGISEGMYQGKEVYFVVEHFGTRR